MRHLLGAVEWSDGIEDAWADTAASVPKLLAFLLILAVGIAAAKLLSGILVRLLDRLGFSRAVERGGGVARLAARSNHDASNVVEKVLFYGLLLVVLQVALSVFGDSAAGDLVAGVVAFLPRLGVAVLLVVAAAALAAAAREAVSAALKGLPYATSVASWSSVAIVVLGGFMALSQLGVAPHIVNALFYGVVAAAAGSVIVAVGGGGIQPMRQRWERALARWDDESPRVRSELAQARADRRARREIDLRDAPAPAPKADDTTSELPAPTPAGPQPEAGQGGRAMSTQDRIRAEVKSDPTLP